MVVAAAAAVDEVGEKGAGDEEEETRADGYAGYSASGEGCRVL